MFIIQLFVYYFLCSLSFVYFTDTTKIVDTRNMIAVQDRDHPIVANTEERIIDAKKNIMMNVTNIEVICLKIQLFVYYFYADSFVYISESEGRGERSSREEARGERSVEKERDQERRSRH